MSLGIGPQSLSDNLGLHASAVGAEGAEPRRTRRTRSKVRGPRGGEAPAFCAVAPPGLEAGLRQHGGGVRSGPASTRACEPRSAWPPGLFWGLQVSRTTEGLRRLSSGSGHFVCPLVHLPCRLPTAISAENGRTKGGGGPGAPKDIQGPRYPAPAADTFGFSPSHRCRPRHPGPVLGAAASSPLPVRLCFCVCLAVPELVPTPELILPCANSPRLPSPFPWQVR